MRSICETVGQSWWLHSPQDPIVVWGSGVPGICRSLLKGLRSNSLKTSAGVYNVTHFTTVLIFRHCWEATSWKSKISFLKQVPTAPGCSRRSCYMCRARTNVPFFTTVAVWIGKCGQKGRAWQTLSHQLWDWVGELPPLTPWLVAETGIFFPCSFLLFLPLGNAQVQYFQQQLLHPGLCI